MLTANMVKRKCSDEGKTRLGSVLSTTRFPEAVGGQYNPSVTGRMLISSPNSSPKRVPKGLQIWRKLQLYTVENKRAPGARARLLTEGL